MKPETPVYETGGEARREASGKRFPAVAGPRSLVTARPHFLAAALCTALTGAIPFAAHAQTEVHYQYGSQTNPFTEVSNGTTVLTMQHASQWKFGDNFYFVDLIDDGSDDGFNEMDAYGEWYSNFSLGKLSGNDLAVGPIADFGLFMGAALGTDANFRQWLPGARVAWSIPGFIFLNTDLALGIDGGRGLALGSPPELDNRFILDVNGLYLFSIGGQSFSITGHAEYAAATGNELGSDVPASILAQPQFRWNIGGGNLHIGIEYQYWSNKLGTEFTESIVQWLGVWQF